MHALNDLFSVGECLYGSVHHGQYAWAGAGLPVYRVSSETNISNSQQEVDIGRDKSYVVSRLYVYVRVYVVYVCMCHQTCPPLSPISPQTHRTKSRDPTDRVVHKFVAGC